MAIIIGGRTVCGVCGTTLNLGDDVLSTPYGKAGEYWREEAKYWDASFHRRCFPALPDEITRGWWEWWTEVAVKNDGIFRPGVIACSLPSRFALVMREECLIIEERWDSLPSLIRLFSEPPSPGIIHLEWNRCEVNESGHLTIGYHKAELLNFKGQLSESRRAEAANALSALLEQRSLSVSSPGQP